MFIDRVILCDKHLGDVHPPRCYDCEALQTSDRAPVTKDSMCSKHPDYPSNDRWPCVKCDREAHDHGVRCDRHRSEVFLPDCAACDSLAREYTFWNIPKEAN